MGLFQATPELPIIDFTKENLEAGSSSWLLTSNEVRHALEGYGCFFAVYDKQVSLELNKDVFCALKELFDLPLETKVQNVSEKPHYYGYLKLPMLPLYESLGIEDPTTVEGIQRFTKGLFPAGNDHFCEIMHSHATLLSELEKMVMRMIFESYGVEKHYEAHLESISYLIRVMKYRVPQKEETHIGALEVHTDKGFISILHQNQVNGLEVKTKAGEWINVDFPPSSFIVMAGDALLAWSNDIVHSAFHRVIIKGDEERYSLGLFSYINGIINTPEELIDEEHPRRYKPYDHYGLLDFYANNVDLHAECTVKAYCAV